MKHTLRQNEHTIYVTFEEGIEPEESTELVYQVISILKKTPNRMNFVMIVQDAYLTNMQSIYTVTRLMKPFIKRFNYGYVIGATGIQKTFAKTFFSLISLAGKKRVFFFETLTKITL